MMLDRQPRAGVLRRCHNRERSSTAFTLVELLVVIAVISIITAIVLPAFMRARGHARETVCLSNLRSLGLAMSTYMDDYDGVFPWGGDPSDKYTNIWSTTKYQPAISSMPLLTTVLDPYVKAPRLWECPSDTGFDTLDMTPSGFSPIHLAARPTMFDAFQSSYLYRTEITLLHKTQGNLTATDSSTPPKVYDASEINVLMDGNGSWHGYGGVPQRRFNVLMADGHVVDQDMTDYFHTWSLQIVP